MLKRLYLCVVLIFTLISAEETLYAGREKSRVDTSRKFAVEVSAKVAEKKPYSITLNWTESPSFSYVIYRRIFGQKVWLPVPLAVLDGNALTYTDKKVKPDVIYEYRIDRIGKDFIGKGYICAGTNIPVVDNRGKVILLVDSSVADALTNELKRLEFDLIGDAWQVARFDIDPATSAPDVKKIIVNEYQKSPENTKAVFLFGKISVPYSGCIFPDGHTNHNGAWPADLYYGDMDGEWTDKEKKKYHPRYPKQHNEIGDGKFDQSTIKPNSVELAVGRVDLSGMTMFPLNEVELLRQYLNKDHFYRYGYLTAAERGLIDDNFGGFRGEAFGSDGLRSFAAFFGADKIDDLDWFNNLPEKQYLWAYGCGGGSNFSANGVGHTKDFVNLKTNAFFTMLFGSYFGDWNHDNNFLRAPLANSGYGLTCCWAGRPHWYLHQMALGKDIGYSTLRTQNNHPLLDYIDCQQATVNQYEGKIESEWSYNSIHVALMGDPTLRMHVVKPPRITDVSEAAIKWTPSPEKELMGYHVYAADSFDAEFKRLTKEPVTTCEFPIKSLTEKIFIVKAVKNQKSASGSYINTSQGVFAKHPVSEAVHQAPNVPDILTLTTKEDESVIINPGDTAKLYSALAPDKGTISYKNGKMIFTPNPDVFGTVNVMVIPWNGLNDLKPINVCITIEPVPDAPRVQDHMVSLPNYDEFSFKLNVVDPDTKPENLSYKLITQPKVGKLSGKAPNLKYSLDESVTDNQSFKFNVSDGNLTSDDVTVTLIPPKQCLKATNKKTIDAKLDDWDYLKFVCKKPEQLKEVEKVNSWKGEKDCHFSFSTAYDDDYLYIAVNVIDDQIIAKKGVDPWKQDGVEIRLDARPLKLRASNNGRKGEMKDFLLIAMSPGTSLDDPWIYMRKKNKGKKKIKGKEQKAIPDGTKYACIRNDKGFNCEIAIPIKYLNEKAGKDWDGFRFNIFVDDRDDDGLVQICWKPDWRSGKTYNNSGSFIKK